MIKPFLIIVGYIIAFLIVICVVKFSKRLVKKSNQGKSTSEFILVLSSAYGIMTIIIKLLNKIL